MSENLRTEIVGVGPKFRVASVISFHLGSGVTSGATLDADGNDQRCFSSKNGNTAADTVTTKVHNYGVFPLCIKQISRQAKCGQIR